MDQVIKDLLNTKAYLLSHGWHQGSLVVDESKPFFGQAACLNGALNLAINPRVNRVLSLSVGETQRFHAAYRTVQRMHTRGTNSCFNDAPETTLPDVLNLIDQAISARKQLLNWKASQEG